MINGFKTFIMRGNVIDLAVAVVIGAAFGAVITSVVDHLINPLIAVVGGGADLSSVAVIPLPGDAAIQLGTILGDLITFVLVAATIYALVVFPMNRLAERRKAGVEPEPQAPAEDVLLLQEIRDLLRDQRAPR